MENTTNVVRLRQPGPIDDPLTELLVERRPGVDHVRPHFQVRPHASRAGAGGAQKYFRGGADYSVLPGVSSREPAVLLIRQTVDLIPARLRPDTWGRSSKCLTTTGC
jgi:hypothetical protein